MTSFDNRDVGSFAIHCDKDGKVDGVEYYTSGAGGIVQKGEKKTRNAADLDLTKNAYVDRTETIAILFMAPPAPGKPGDPCVVQRGVRYCW